MLKDVYKQKSLLILTSLILILCAVFIFISCGAGPQLKVQDPDKGAFALDFSSCSGDYCRVLLLSSDLPSSVGNKPLTAEAWVKVKATNTTGAIMGYHEQEGLMMFVRNNVPNFSIVRVIGTSTSFTVSSGVSLIQDAWTHIAGVITDNAHSHVSTTSCPPAVMIQEPHLDIFVEGTFRDCATSGSAFPGVEPSLEVPLAVGVRGDRGVVVEAGIDTDTPFNGIIDEVRLWGTDRTESEINACMNGELSNDGGTCGRLQDTLILNLRFNEGEESSTFDWAGLLGSGVMESVTAGVDDWTTGWTSDTPGLVGHD